MDHEMNTDKILVCYYILKLSYDVYRKQLRTNGAQNSFLFGVLMSDLWH